MSAESHEDPGAKSDADPAGTVGLTKDAVLRSALDAIIDNLAVFAGELDGAAKLFRDTQTLDGGRIGCMVALKAVVDFCDRAELGPKRRHPLLQLYVALESADNGAVDPLLKVTLQAGAPPLTEAERRQRGCLAAAMEALIRGGAKPDDAARWVAHSEVALVV